MCNLYSLIRPQAEIRAPFGGSVDPTGNLPAMPGIFPDQHAPIVRAAVMERADREAAAVFRL